MIPQPPPASKTASPRTWRPNGPSLPLATGWTRLPPSYTHLVATSATLPCLVATSATLPCPASCAALGGGRENFSKRLAFLSRFLAPDGCASWRIGVEYACFLSSKQGTKHDSQTRQLHVRDDSHGTHGRRGRGERRRQVRRQVRPFDRLLLDSGDVARPRQEVPAARLRRPPRLHGRGREGHEDREPVQDPRRPVGRRFGFAGRGASDLQRHHPRHEAHEQGDQGRQDRAHRDGRDRHHHEAP